jgi:hypothetical protein
MEYIIRILCFRRGDSTISMTWLPESEAPLAQETREGGKEMQRMLPNPIANAATLCVLKKRGWIFAER